MYEDRTYEKLLSEMLARVPVDIDTREGSVVYDMLAPVAWDTSELYRALREVINLVLLPTAVGEYLDAWGWTVGLERHPATSAIYQYSYDGEQPPLGERFFYDGQYFQLRLNEDDILVLEAEDVGSQTNDVILGSPAIPISTLPKLKAASFASLLRPGVDRETDDDYRERIHEQLA